MHLLSFLDPKFLITAFGLIGVIAVIFMETGLFIGFFLPGDSLLFTAGFFASQGYMPLWLLFLGVFVAAVVGDTVGYALGKKFGPSLFARENSTFFNKDHIAKAQHFYEQHGAKTIVLARFMPVVRTFAPVVAGIGNMHYPTFLRWNILGGLLWTGLMTGLGYTLGAVVPNPDRYVIPAVLVIIATSAIPAIREIFRKRNI